jgi:hypothetical protein
LQHFVADPPAHDLRVATLIRLPAHSLRIATLIRPPANYASRR